MVTIQLSQKQIDTLREASKIVEMIDKASQGGLEVPARKAETKKEREARIAAKLKNKYS